MHHLNLRKIAQITFILLSMISIQACKEGNFLFGKKEKEGTLIVSILPKWNNSLFTINETYSTADSIDFVLTQVRANLTIGLKNAEGNNLELNEPYKYINLKDTSTYQTMEFNVPAGNYTTFSISIGLDSALNHQDPALFDNDHDLSIFTNDHWSWSDGYRFLSVEGMGAISDSVTSLTNPLLFHVGLDTLYTTKEFDVNFELEKKDAHSLSLDWNIDTFFDGAHKISIDSAAVTHTDGAFELAKKMIENATNAFDLN